MRTTTLTWVSTTWSPSLKRWWTSSWCSNSTSGHATDLILVSNPWFLGARNHFGPFPEALDWIEGQEWVCPESEFLHEELHHLLREGDHVVDTHGNVVVRTKRDHFSKYAPKRSNHANFQLLKIKNKKVMTKKPLIVENTNPLKDCHKSCSRRDTEHWPMQMEISSITIVSICFWSINSTRGISLGIKQTNPSYCLWFTFI